MRKVIQTIWQLLSSDERKKAWSVSVTVLVNALLDFAGLAALLPVLYYLLEGVEHRRAALLFCLIAVCVCGIKYLLSIRFTLIQQRFLLDIYKRISMSLYHSYYRRGLLFIRENGFSKLNYEINGLCYNFSEGVLASLLQIIGEGLLLVIILTALTIYSPLCSMVLVLLFLPFVWIYLRLIRTKVKHYGEQVMKAQRRQGRIVNDTFAGYVELEVNDSFGAYKRHFLQGMEEIEDGKLKMVTINRLPSILAELAVVIGLTLVAAGIFGDVKLLLGIFVVAAFKLLPALKSILTGWTRIQNSTFSIDTISNGLKADAPLPVSHREIAFTSSIRFEGVSYAYPDSGNVFQHLSFQIAKGEYVGLKGYSGVGKSTLFNLLLGFLEPQEGEIRIDDTVLTESGRQSWLRKIGYVPQDVFIFRGNLIDNISMGDPHPDREKMTTILKKLRLGDWLAQLPQGLETDLCELGSRLSGGQRQRIGLARAIYKNMELLLLDEATSALDNKTEAEINQVLEDLRQDNNGLTIVSIAHRESSMAYCDRVVSLDETGEDE